MQPFAPPLDSGYFFGKDVLINSIAHYFNIVKRWGCKNSNCNVPKMEVAAAGEGSDIRQPTSIVFILNNGNTEAFCPGTTDGDRACDSKNVKVTFEYSDEGPSPFFIYYLLLCAPVTPPLESQLSFVRKITKCKYRTFACYTLNTGGEKLQYSGVTTICTKFCF